MTSAAGTAAGAAAAGAAAAAAGGVGGGSSCSCCCLQLLLLLWVCCSAAHVLYAAAALRWLRAAAAGWQRLSSEQRQRFAPFERYDWHQLSTPRVLLGAFFLAPVRFVILISLLVVNNAGSRALAVYYGLGDSSPDAEFAARKAPFAALFHFCCSIFLKVFGIVRTVNVFYDGTYRQGPDAFECKNIVSNHVSCMDIMYFLTQAYTAFVCKASIKDTLLISWPARFLRCIFVDRENETDRRKALGALRDRMQLGDSNPTRNPIVVFPEGTTTNGRCVISFKRGAFVALEAVQPCVLIYSAGCMHPAYELIPSAYFMSLTLSAWPAAELRAFWLKPMSPPPISDFPSEEKRVEAFAKQVRNAMWEVLRKEHYAPMKFEGLECLDTYDGSSALREECVRELLKEMPDPVFAKKAD